MTNREGFTSASHIAGFWAALVVAVIAPLGISTVWADGSDLSKPLPPAEDDHPEELPDSLDTHPEVPEAFDGYSERWTGAYIGGGLFGGAGVIGNEAVSSDPFWSMGAKARFSMVQNLFDIQLDYRYGEFAGHFEKTAAMTLSHHAVGLSFGVHPLFLLNLGASPIYYALASMYLQIGLSVDQVGVEIPSRFIAEGVWGWGLIMGTGIDFPVTDPDASGSVWLGTQFRWQSTTLDAPPFEKDGLSEHLFWIRVSYRHNGFVF